VDANITTIKSLIEIDLLAITNFHLPKSEQHNWKNKFGSDSSQNGRKEKIVSPY
jgi:hypothetical protein